MRGVNDLDWEEIKNITAEGGRKVKEKMTAQSRFSNMNLGLLLGVTFCLELSSDLYGRRSREVCILRVRI